MTTTASNRMLVDVVGSDTDERERLVPHSHSSWIATSSSSSSSPTSPATLTSMDQQPVHAQLPHFGIAFTDTVSTSSSVSSSPTLSASSISSSSETVSFSFVSPLFYDQKLYIYHNLLYLYKQVGRLLTNHPHMLLYLQYSIAAIQGFTVYLLSVVLSVAHLVITTATIMNLNWSQTYKPRLREWNNRFPLLVAHDIRSENRNNDSSLIHGRWRSGSRYGSAHALPLKTGDDMDDGYHSEETQKRQTIGISSMNWILRRRFVKCHQWMPSMWSAEDNSIVKDDQDQVVDESDKESANKDTSMESMNRYSSIRRALVRTLSGSVKPSKSKRVTFNEQVLILGRRLSGDVAKETASSSSPSVPANLSMTPHTVPEDVPSTAKGSPALEAGSKPATATSGLDTSNRTLTAAQTNDILQEETEYQTTIAAQDINGSGSSSPVCHHCSAHSTASLPPELSPAASATSSSSSQMSSDSSVTKDSPELRRSASAPLKLGSFFNRNNHRGNSNSNVPQQNTLTQHSATFSESSTLGQNPRAATVNITLPSYSSTGTCTATTSFMVPQRQELSSAESTPRSSLSLGTRAKRSISLVIPRPNSVISATSTVDSPKSNSSSTELQGSIGRKNKNLMYRIVHPQRYKREMEQQLMEQERQRLLTLALLQRRELLAAETTADSVGAKDHLCGDAYFYATSAEYIEGLGARNSVISTSVGISFPEELQDKKPQFKNRGTRPRPASYEYGYTPKALFPGMYDSSSESDIATETSGTAARSSQETPRSRSFVFKRGEKKNGSVSSTKSSKGTRSNGPPNRLQQLFSHPGHKQTQSTSSLIHPPGSAGTYSTATAEMGLQGLPIEVLNVSLEDEHLLPEPVFSSSAAAGAHQLLSRARSDSRTYTSFTTIGTTPAFPPTQSTFSAICSKSSGRTQTSTDRTSFADFGFPSPTLSPVDSMQPASPRHSTSSVHSDMVYSSVEYRAGEQEEQQQQHHHHELLLPEQSSFGREIMFSISPEHAPQQLQELQPVDVNQVKYEMPMQLPTLTEPMTPGTSPESSLIVKESRGKCIMRKFSLRKKKT